MNNAVIKWIGFACLALALVKLVSGASPPVPVGKFKCVLVPGSKMTAAQTAALGAPEVRAYLDEKCGKEGWRLWSTDVDASNYKDGWAELWSTAKAKITYTPAVVKIRGNRIDVEPLPADKTSLLASLKKAGG